MRPNKSAIMSNVAKCIAMIAEECKELSLYVMSSENGWNDRPHAQKNTLVGSDLYNDLKVDDNGVDLVRILVKGYIDYIQGGVSPNHWVPIDVLLEWMSRKGISTENGIAYAIQRSIFNRGIKPRPIFEVSEYGEWTSLCVNHDNTVFQIINEEYWDKWAEELFEVSTEFLDEWFDE